MSEVARAMAETPSRRGFPDGPGGASRARLVYGDVDDLGLEYLELVARYDRGGLAAQQLTDMVGTYCKRCGERAVRPGRKTEVIVGDRTKPGRWSTREECSNCRRVWQEEHEGELHVMKEIPTSKRPKRGDHEAPIVHLVDRLDRLAPLVERRPRAMTKARWDLCLMSWLGVLVFGGYAAVIRWGKESKPEYRPYWVEHIVRPSVERARREVRRRARRNGAVFQLEPETR